MLMIGEALQLDLTSQKHTRDDLEQILTNELERRRAHLANDSNWKGLYESLDRDARREV